MLRYGVRPACDSARASLAALAGAAKYAFLMDSAECHFAKVCAAAACCCTEHIRCAMGGHGSEVCYMFDQMFASETQARRTNIVRVTRPEPR